MLGPDKCSSFTTTNYYVQSIATGRYFYTDDVLETATVPSSPEPAEPILFLPERQEVPPILQDGVPTRRLRGKTAVPAVRSMMNIEGRRSGVQVLNLVRFPIRWLGVVLKFLIT